MPALTEVLKADFSDCVGFDFAAQYRAFLSDNAGATGL
jgi:hypothetical protein